jgi:hypothetical protein
MVKPTGAEAAAGAIQVEAKQDGPRQAARPAIETVRIECLKVAMERVTANKPPRSIIGEAREFEAYVLGEDETE